MSDIQRVLLVGHCRADTGMLTRFVRRHADGLPVVSVNDAQTLHASADSACLILVNRVPVGSFDALDGVGLIERVLGREDPPVAMLVSNYADAQSAAVDAGARHGFGKGELGHPDTAKRLREAIGAEAPAA
ncbi:MAG: hypothetical protein AAGB29_14920 [Planctomycetota bacterium]